MWRTAVSATVHRLTGCAIGEVLRSGVALRAAVGMPLAVAFVVTVPVNRALIMRGKGHAVVHGVHH